MESLQPIRRVLSRKALGMRLRRLGLDLAAAATLAGVLLALGVALVGLPAAPVALLFVWSILLWAVVLSMLARAVVSQLRPVDPVALALRLEALAGGMHSELASALELGLKGKAAADDLGVSWTMVEALAQKVRADVPRIAAIPVGDRRIPRQAALLLLVGVSVAALGLGSPARFGRAVAAAASPWSVSPWARQALTLEPGSITVTEGATITLTARGRGQGNDAVVLELRRSTGTAVERVPMRAEMPGVWSHVLAGVVATFDCRATGRRSATPWQTITVMPVPRVGDISLAVTPPQYTGLPATATEGTGNLRCYPGSLVRWRGRCNVGGATITLELGDGQAVPLRPGPDGGQEGEFTVLTGGRYRVSARHPAGGAAPPDEYDIVLLQDDLPAVEVTSPGEDLELDRAALLEVHYTGRDDFGLTSGALVWLSDDGREGRLPLTDGGGRRTVSGSTGWDLAELGLESGRSVWFQVELKDNDTISGPKAGTSAGRLIRIRDNREVHQGIEADEKELRQELTDLLGDELEVSAEMGDLRGAMEAEPDRDHREGLETLGERQSAATRKFEQAMEKFDRLLDARAEDPFSDPAALYMKVLARQMLSSALGGERQEEEHLRDLRRTEELTEPDRAREMGWMGEQKERRIGSMEQALSLLDESNQQQNMEQAVSQQQRMADTQRDLVDMLEKMKGGIPAAEAAAMRRMLEEISRSLEQLMDALGSMQRELPEEFVNADALKSMDMKDMMADLSRLAEALKSGDLEGARKAAESLLKGMNDLLERLKTAAAEQRRTSTAGMEDFARKRVSELEQLVKRQRELLRQTEAIDGESRSRQAAERSRDGRERLEAAAAAAREAGRRLAAARASLERERLRSAPDGSALRELENRLAELAGAAGRGDQWRTMLADAGAEVERRSLEMGRAADRDPRFSRAAELVDEAARLLRDALPDEPAAGGAASFTREEEESMARLSAEQAAAGATAGKMAAAVETMAAALPLIPAELGVSLREASGFMASATGKLAGRAPGEAVPDQREALYRLMQAQNAAAQAASQMGKLSGLQSGGQAAGDEAGTLFGLLPGGTSSGGRNRREGGRTGISVRNFRIPGSQEYQVPREFREELLESMKAGYPRNFEKAIRDYFRSIAE